MSLKKKPNQEEHKIQCSLINFCMIIAHLEPDFSCLKHIYAIPNGGLRHPFIAKKLQKEGVKKGVWDLFLPKVLCPYGGAYFEVKTPTNNLTPEQLDFREQLHDEYKFYKVTSKKELALGVCDYLDLPIERLDKYL